jgi:hypothetical protein
MFSTNPSPNIARRHLQNVRSVLLRLHKTLLESERVQYEQVHGRIASSGQFFRLVVGDEWFNWLRPMSQFIVRIDESLSAKDPMTLDQANELLDAARTLVHPSEHGTISEQRYFEAIQRDPDVAIMHVEISDLLAAPQ